MMMSRDVLLMVCLPEAWFRFKLTLAEWFR